eukprot:Hpha_TRINITY_DN21390_c0_g1::TRINITY_DN21390_c0_g1_i1::g.192558::m.192558
MGEYLVFARIDGDELRPVEVPISGTVDDLRAAMGVGNLSILTFKGEELPAGAELADLGIGPQSVVEVDTRVLEDDMIKVSGAGLEAANGIYQRQKEYTNGGTFWVKIDPSTKEQLGVCIHFYWGPQVNGRKINGWLLGSKQYCVDEIFYARACGEPKEEYYEDSQTDVPQTLRFFPPDDGWEHISSTNHGSRVTSPAPAPTLMGKQLLKGMPLYPPEDS